jgi:isoquinoline 1-oxidoreductase beta subunit
MKDYGWQGTGASTSIRDGFGKLRVMGATAREMLLSAAAAAWSVPREELTASESVITHAKTKRTSTFGQLAARAAEERAPRDPPLKDPLKWRLVGKPIARLDLEEKVTGKAIFGIDVKRPGMLIAMIERPPLLGGKLKSLDATKALAVPGVKQVFAIPTGVAVLGDHFWAAKKGREALTVEWEGGGSNVTNASIRAELAAVIDAGKDARKDGDPDAVLAKAEKKLESLYELPFLAHATMEPMNCTAEVTKKSCEVWVGTQSSSQTLQTAKEITGLEADQISIHTTYLGGGFGRRSKVDFAVDAVYAAKQAGVPVKVIWTREDDMRGGWYRPAALARMSGALDANGNVIAWKHAIAGYPILGLKEGLDPFSLEGAKDLAYGIPNLRVSYACPLEQRVPTWFWRSVGSSQTAFAVECFVDELAELAGQDPLEMRRKLLVGSTRHRRVLNVAADKAKWGGTVAEGHALGIALHTSFGSMVAQVADVSMDGDRVRVHRVVCAIDCGEVVNPNTIEAQMQSGIVYGLSAALYGGISIENGRVKESNFHDHPILRIGEMPVVETHIIPGGPPIGGVGEPGTPPIAPAVANAVYKLTGKRVRSLPMMRVLG